MLGRILNKITGMAAIDSAYKAACKELGTHTIFQASTKVFDIGATVSQGDLGRIPKNGPLIIVANHPLGFPEGLVLPALIDDLRDDLKILSHNWFERWPEMAKRMIFVNPQAKGAENRANGKAILEAARWLRDGHSLLVFPAGEVARFQWGKGQVCDIPWKTGLARLVKMSGATVSPIQVNDRAGFLYQVLSVFHRRLGIVVLGRELLAWRKRKLSLRIGKPVFWTQENEAKDLEDLTSTYRRSIEEL